MKMNKLALACFAAALAPSLAAGQGMAITQIATENLLLGQSVRLYLSAPGAAAAELPEVEVWESGEAGVWTLRPVRAVTRGVNEMQGISFLLLLDNSGSMWTGLDGRGDAPAEDQRMAHAKEAARSFLSEVSPLDHVGLTVFNTRYWRAAVPAGDPGRVRQALEEIRRPTREDAYTELYLSL
ncbi:MAG TPA: VWA domain-containing protein, partial [Magnetospirillaceae bacterium]|nr:VWA domain-containing protein [Magnetospirillaceae bacterium]